MRGIQFASELSVAALLMAFLSTGSSVVMAQQAAAGGGLRVGAARVDITPPAPEGNKIRDRLYATAIVIDNGTTRAALIGADQISFGEQAWADVTKRIAAEFKIPIEHQLTSATHTHSDGRFGVAAPLGAATGRGATPPGGRATGSPPAAGRGGGAPPPAGRGGGQPASTVLNDAAVEAVRRAVARLQPARVGYGAGQSHFNVNRDAIHPETKR
jgi:neutral ceramidase